MLTAVHRNVYETFTNMSRYDRLFTIISFVVYEKYKFIVSKERN